MLLHYHFEGNIPGPNILIIWSIHWDETCGSYAIEELRKLITTWKLEIKCGSITCVPYANHRAFLLKKRQINVNLNRVFGKWLRDKRIHIDEITAIKKIQQLIWMCDFLLDLHSFPFWEDIPFMFKDVDNPELSNIFAHMPVEYMVSWWNQLYHGSSELDTIWYANNLTKLWFCLECWISWSLKADKVASECILSVLSYFWIIDGNLLVSTTSVQKEVKVNTIIRKPIWWQFARHWKNFDKISNGAVIWIDKDGREVRSNQDWYIVIPNEYVEEWWEWCYLWTKTFLKN